MTDMTPEHALQKLLATAEGNPFCPVGHLVEHGLGGADALRAALSRPADTEASRTLDALIALAAGEPCRTINIDDIVAWADGVQGALGTEHANRVTEREAAASRAVMAAIASAPNRCPHGVRRPHECKECADAVPASEALEWAEREFAAARQSPGEPVPVETTAEESSADAGEPRRFETPQEFVQWLRSVRAYGSDAEDTWGAAEVAAQAVEGMLEQRQLRPNYGSDIVYEDRVDQGKGVKHCDDCGHEFPNPVYVEQEQPEGGPVAAPQRESVTVRYDLSPAQTESAIRDALIRMGWTPPEGESVATVKAERDALREQLRQLEQRDFQELTRANERIAELEAQVRTEAPAELVELLDRLSPPGHGIALKGDPTQTFHTGHDVYLAQRVRAWLATHESRLRGEALECPRCKGTGSVCTGTIEGVPELFDCDKCGGGGQLRAVPQAQGHGGEG